MRQDFARDALLLFNRRIDGSFRPILDERFLRIRGLAMNQPHEADKLIPGLPVRVTVLAGVNRRQFPLVFAGKWLDGLSQSRSHSFYLSRRTLCSAGLPQVRAQIELLHPKPIPLVDASFKLFRSRQIVKLRKMT